MGVVGGLRDGPMGMEEETKLNQSPPSPLPFVVFLTAKVLQDIFIGLDLVAVPSTDVPGDCYEDVRFSVAVFVSRRRQRPRSPSPPISSSLCPPFLNIELILPLSSSAYDLRM